MSMTRSCSSESRRPNSSDADTPDSDVPSAASSSARRPFATAISPLSVSMPSSFAMSTRRLLDFGAAFPGCSATNDSISAAGASSDVRCSSTGIRRPIRATSAARSRCNRPRDCAKRISLSASTTCNISVTCAGVTATRPSRIIDSASSNLCAYSATTG